MDIGQGRTVENYKSNALGVFIGMFVIIVPIVIVLIPFVLLENLIKNIGRHPKAIC